VFWELLKVVCLQSGVANYPRIFIELKNEYISSNTVERTCSCMTGVNDSVNGRKIKDQTMET
jgi:hypothetical protein